VLFNSFPFLLGFLPVVLADDLPLADYYYDPAGQALFRRIQDATLDVPCAADRLP
jgi:hypothetical protein